MAENELLIKINADAKNAQKAFEDVKSQTEDLEGQLATVAKISAVAFAALTAEVFLSVKAFGDAQAATKKLSATLQNQGIFTTELVEKYREYAAVVQEKTGLDDDAIVQAQAVAQAYLGQTEVTKELTFAIADLAEKQGGDLNAAAEMIGKTIGTNTNAFKRQGLEISATATESERMAKVLEFVNLKAGGLAEAANQGIGGIRGLRAAFGDFQESIGERFAPVIESAIRVSTRFFRTLNEYPIIADMTVALIAGAGALAAIGIAAPAVISAITTISAAAAAFGVTMNVAFLGIPLLIAGVVAAVAFLALNWEKSFAVAKSVVVGFLTFMSEAFSGLGKILSGAFSLDRSQIQAGLEQIKASFAQAKQAAVTSYQETTAVAIEEQEKQIKAKKDAADREAAIEREKQANLRAIRKAEVDLLKLETEFASQEQIELKQREIAILRALSEEKSAQELALLRTQREQVIALQDEQRAEDQARRNQFREEDLAVQQELAELDLANAAQLRDAERVQIEASLMTESDAERKIRGDMLKEKIKEYNTQLEERKRYGAAVAAINAVLRSEEVGAAKEVSGELIGLAQSKNATLKSIGKAAAVAQITIATAESAVSIARSVAAVVPFPFNIPLIATLVGARIAFGAEQIGNVLSAQDGGLVTGGIPGKDSVPALLEPGELVVPKRNFNEVVGAVQGQNGGEDSAVLAALQAILDKIGSVGNTIIQGDVMTDDAYIDTLVRKISDAVEFRNAQIFGVTT